MIDAEKTKFKGLSPNGTVRTISNLARVMGMSRTTLYKWKKEPGFPVEVDGSFDPEQILIWRYGHNDVEDDTDTSVNDTKKVTARKETKVSEKVKWDTEFRKYRAKLSETSYRKELGELISRTEVEQLLVARAVEFKKALLGRSRRLSLRLAHKDSQTIQKVIDEDSKQILETYSRPNSVLDKKKVKKRNVRK